LTVIEAFLGIASGLAILSFYLITRTLLSGSYRRFIPDLSGRIVDLLTNWPAVNTAMERLGRATFDVRGVRFTLGADLAHKKLQNADLSYLDLRYANLARADLSGADLSNTDLGFANLQEADLSLARLPNANLTGVNLVRANLSGADLRDVNLEDADLTKTNLNGANLSGADLRGANFKTTRLSESDFTGATCHYTTFADVDLSTAKGLESIVHVGSSQISVDTIFSTSGDLPAVFLRGSGVPEQLISSLPSLRGEVIEFYSCFISYSHADADFARLLHDRLQGRGIRCWLDDHQILPGEKIAREVSLGIRIWDKVLLCCSETALHSWWVDREISMVLGKEEELTKQRGEEVLALIPLDLDGYLLESYSGEYRRALKARNVASFKGWNTDHALFKTQLDRVIRALTVGGGKLPPPQPKL